MTATTLPREEAPSGFKWVLSDIWTEALRHLRAIPRSPELMIFSAIQPVMFILLFLYVFGGSIIVPGYDSYKQFLIPGTFTQTVLFGSSFTAVGLAEDMSKGLIDRLRSLPMYEPAVIIGRTLSDLLRNVFTFLVMLVVAYAVGFRIKGTVPEALAATALLLGFSYAFSWVQAFVGLSVKSVEGANSGGFIWMFPLTFVSSAFVDPTNMTPWLRRIAEANPFTIATDATRALYNGREVGNDLIIATAYAVGITTVFAFLAVRKFRSGRT